MEIFQEGELEAEITKHELRATSVGSWWHLFSKTYEEMVELISRPVRAIYSINDLGHEQIQVASSDARKQGQEFIREDFYLENQRGEQLACSFWRRRHVRDGDPIVQLMLSLSCLSDEKKKKRVDDVIRQDTRNTERRRRYSDWNCQQTRERVNVDPCIIYLHGMSSSRKECIYMHRKILAKGFSLFAMDLSGSGLSGGDRVSFGSFERDDVRTAVDYLNATGRASAVGIWGRDIGSVAALLHVKDRMPYSYTTRTVSAREAAKLEIVKDETDHQLLCIPPLTGLKFRFHKYSAINGDFVLLAIDSTPVQGLSPASCYRLIQQSCKTNDGQARLHGYKRSSSKYGNDNFIFALTADCAYGDMEQVIWDMLQMITKSAERRSLFFPSAMVTAVQKLLSNSIGKAGGFSFSDVRLLDAVPHFTLPCLFISASKKDFFMPEHTKVLFNRYGGSKSYVQFTGQIDDNRPDEVLDTVISHFSKRLKLLKK
ncbi:unnamed protein product [Peronospora belbahrii]|uniref:Serine aminopeptidase S33 domain-containing protein n=1 Tax=Peronospora belbahrii TaxID=622444 RepID=A0AAU9L091_9STRA|nr:unnamed protein product [Peronospora belbahrii]CAH0516439.1 unnamed protein product [Peronospora belbahrii]